MANPRTVLLQPSRYCCCCGKTQEETSGHRVICAHFTGLTVRSRTLVETWGSCWTEKAQRLAEDTLSRGQHPWICQRCAHVGLCRLCGSLNKYVGGIDTLHDDGTYWHCPILPVGNLMCTNLGCAESVRGVL